MTYKEAENEAIHRLQMLKQKGRPYQPMILLAIGNGFTVVSQSLMRKLHIPTDSIATFVDLPK